MFSGTHKEYQIAEHVQAEMRAEADCCRLAHSAPTEADAVTEREIIHFHLNWAAKGAFIVLTIVVMLVAGQQVFAQGASDPIRPDPGNDPGGEPLAAYREGLYYLNHDEYEMAVVKFSEAIDGLPEVLFEMPGYADMYWFLGEAQEASGMFAEALVSYQTFLDLVGDNAAPWTFNHVDLLAQDMNAVLLAEFQS